MLRTSAKALRENIKTKVILLNANKFSFAENKKTTPTMKKPQIIMKTTQVSKPTKIESDIKDVKNTKTTTGNAKEVFDYNITSNIKNNSSFSRYLSILNKFHSYSFEKTYTNKIVEAINEKINLITNEIIVLKVLEKRNENDNKTQNLKIFKSQPPKQNKTGGSDIFSSKSIKEFEEKLALTSSQDKTLKFKTLTFYTERNIDKAFKYFYDNLKNEALSAENKKDFTFFLLRNVELDKTIYLNTIFDYLELNKITLNTLIPKDKFEECFSSYFEYNMNSNYNYGNSLTAFKFLFHYILNSSEKKINLNLNLNVQEAFELLANDKLKNKKFSQNDEVLVLLDQYAKILRKFEEVKVLKTQLSFKDESISKVLTLFFDNTLAIKNENILELIFSLQNYQKNLINLLRENLFAYFQLFGLPPKVVSGANLKNAYFYFRGDLSKAKMTESEAELLLILFKYNNMTEFSADLLSNYGKLTKVEEADSKLYSFYLSDFVLNSKLEKDNFYHKKIDEIYTKKGSIDSIVMKTIAYMKDGNKDFAIENFFNEIESQMKSAKENDKDLLDLYNKTFGVQLKSDKSENKTTAEHEIDSEIEYNFTLQKINLMESIKSDAKSLLYNVKSSTQENIFAAKEKVLKLIKNKKEFEKYPQWSKINESLQKLKNLSFDSVKTELTLKKNQTVPVDKLEDILNVIKVALFKDTSKFNYISDILGKKILFINDIENLEFDQEEKKIFLENLKEELSNKRLNEEDRQFISKVSEYFTLKPVSYSKTIMLTEKSIRNIADEQSALGQANVDSFINSVTEHFRRMRERYSKMDNSYVVVSENVDYLENIKINLKKVYQENLSNKEKIQYFEEIISSYKNILNLLTNKVAMKRMSKLKYFNSTDKIIYTNYEERAHNLILESSKFAKFADRLLFHKLITLGKMKNHRDKNIIKTIHNKKAHLSWNLVHSQNYMQLLAILNKKKIYSTTLKSLNQIEEDIRNKDEDNTYIENIYNSLLEINQIEGEKTDTISVPQTDSLTKGQKLKTIKELLGQEFEIFTPKHAIYIIIYGVEHNIPELIRISEKICCEFGYILPTWVETTVNKYLVKHSSEYSSTIGKIGPVNVANVYRSSINKEEAFDNRGVNSIYDVKPSIWAVDYLPFKGIEEVVDMKKFTMLLRGLTKKGI